MQPSKVDMMSNLFDFLICKVPSRICSDQHLETMHLSNDMSNIFNL